MIIEGFNDLLPASPIPKKKHNIKEKIKKEEKPNNKIDNPDITDVINIYLPFLVFWGREAAVKVPINAPAPIAASINPTSRAPPYNISEEYGARRALVGMDNKVVIRAIANKYFINEFL